VELDDFVEEIVVVNPADGLFFELGGVVKSSTFGFRFEVVVPTVSAFTLDDFDRTFSVAVSC
jgi:hypothetical protein